MRTQLQKPAPPLQQPSSRLVTPSSGASSSQTHDLGRPRSTPPPIQRKAIVSSPDDPFEREADDVADRVMRMSTPGPISVTPAAIQRKCSACEDEEKGAQGVEGEDEEFPPASQQVIFRKADATSSGVDAGSAVVGHLAGRRGRGLSLPEGTRRSMEDAFGHDFSRVRIHLDAEAGRISSGLGARAFTHGSEIYFGEGMYDPEGESGRRLLAHELTHVVQQGEAPPNRSTRAIAPVAATPAATPAIQRDATWAASPASEVNNLANSLINGVAVGVTWPTLNGTQFWSHAEVRVPMRAPTLVFEPVATGGVNARVGTLPVNTGSYNETVLAPGPWSLVVPKATVGARYPALAQCTGAGDTTFRAIGMPSDAAMFTANRRHEDHHATDHQAAFEASIGAWDTQLLLSWAIDQTFHGANQAAAEAALYAAMGGTPNDVADRYFDGCQAAVIAYHGTAAGGGVTSANPTANADCTTSSVESTNPS
jgi:hypothetical protein